MITDPSAVGRFNNFMHLRFVPSSNPFLNKLQPSPLALPVASLSLPGPTAWAGGEARAHLLAAAPVRDYRATTFLQSIHT